MRNCERKSLMQDNGFTLVELLITLVVLSIGLLGLAGFQTQMIHANTFSRDMTIANNIGTDLIEEAKGMSYDPMKKLTDTSGNPIVTTSDHTFRNSLAYLVDIDGDKNPDDPYNSRFRWTRTVTQVKDGLGEFSVEVTVFWDRFRPNPHKLRFKGIAPQGK